MGRTGTKARPAAEMPDVAAPYRIIRSQLRGLFLTFCLILATTAVIYLIILNVGLTRGSVLYILPVMIAAVRWGIVPALFAALCGVLASAYFFFPPLYSFQIRDPQEVINLGLYIFTAILVSQLATQLKRQLELSRRREIYLSDLYAFSRRLAVAFDVSDIHAAIEDHLASVLHRKVVLLAGSRESAAAGGRRGSATVPPQVLAAVTDAASGAEEARAGMMVDLEDGETWLVRAMSLKSSEFGVIAINCGRTTRAAAHELRVRVNAVLADATATLDRLGVSHAISEARMRAQADELREALIGSVSHELRTPLASILGAATVLSAAPALQNEPKLKALVHDVRDEAERLNNDIQNLLDASRISSDGVKPSFEWADPTDIVNTALERCRKRLAGRRVSIDLARELPLIHVDPILVKQALVQIVDNAVKYSPPGSRISLFVRAQEGKLIVSVSDEGAGLTKSERAQMWNQFARGERHSLLASGSGLGLWIASAFIAVNGGTVSAISDGEDRGTTVAIELPVTHSALTHLESGVDE